MNYEWQAREAIKSFGESSLVGCLARALLVACEALEKIGYATDTASIFLCRDSAREALAKIRSEGG